MPDEKLLCARPRCGHQNKLHRAVRNDDSGEIEGYPCDFPNCECEEFTLDERTED